ncbi:MAG: SH3 domain-containing protein [Neglectibacter timonensis]
MEITGGTVNLRLGPGTQYESVAIARKGDRLDKVEENGWIPVILGGKVVWVSPKYAKEG